MENSSQPTGCPVLLGARGGLNIVGVIDVSHEGRNEKNACFKGTRYALRFTASFTFVKRVLAPKSDYDNPR